MKRIQADVDRCSGCRYCEMWCSFTNENVFGSSTSRITLMREDSLGFDLPIVCWHCDPCSAMENCPTEALRRGREGLILVEEEKCIGCEKCSETCLIGAVKLHPERKTPLICNQCNGAPVCVEKCPTKALTWMEEEKEKPRTPDEVVAETLRRWRINA